MARPNHRRIHVNSVYGSHDQNAGIIKKSSPRPDMIAYNFVRLSVGLLPKCMQMGREGMNPTRDRVCYNVTIDRHLFFWNVLKNKELRTRRVVVARRPQASSNRNLLMIGTALTVEVHEQSCELYA